MFRHGGLEEGLNTFRIRFTRVQLEFRVQGAAAFKRLIVCWAYGAFNACPLSGGLC